MKYEKGEKITFVEAIQRIKNGEIVCLSDRYSKTFYKENDKKGLCWLDGFRNNNWDNGAHYDFSITYCEDWYTAKEVEEKFIPTEEELFGWWYKDEDIKIQNSMGISTYTIVKNIKEGWRPVTPEIKNKFLEQVKKELWK